MPKAIEIRSLQRVERRALEAGVRSSNAFRLRRCQMLLASARGETAGHIGQYLSCSDQTVRNAIRAFDKKGLAAFQPGSSVAHHIERAFDTEHAERLRALLHQSPRNFGKPTSLWTLALAAEVSFAQGLTPRAGECRDGARDAGASGEPLRRAKQWISSPDPEYARKKTLATG